MAETSTRTEIASQNQRSLAHPSFPKDIKPWNPQFPCYNERWRKRTSGNRVKRVVTQNDRKTRQYSRITSGADHTRQRAMKKCCESSQLGESSTEEMTVSTAESIANIEGLIDDLLADPSFNLTIKENGGVTILNLFSKVKSVNSAEVMLKFCQFVISVTKMQQVMFHGPLFEDLISFFLDSIRLAMNTKSQLLLLATLRALSFVVFENGTKCISKIPQLLEILYPLADNKRNLDRESQRLAINCLGNLCAKGGATLSRYYKPIFDVLYSLYTQIFREVQFDGSVCKLFSAVLRAMQFVLIEAKSLHEPHTTSLLSAMQKLIFYGTKYNPVSNLSTCSNKHKRITTNKPDNYTNADNSRDSNIDSEDKSDPSIQKFVMKRHKDERFESLTPTIELNSESELSDGDSQSDRFQLWKVRLHALLVVRAVVQCLGVTRFVQYWSQFLPSPLSSTPSLCTVILQDPVHQVRSTAAQLLQDVLRGSAKFLIAAVDSNEPIVTKSFTPLSHTLGVVVKECHRCLLTALQTEMRTTTLIQLLKTLNILVQNAPYERLSEGLLTSVTTQLHPLIFRADEVTVRVAALECLTSVMNTKTPFAEIETILDSMTQQIDSISMTNLVDSLSNYSRSQPPVGTKLKTGSLFLQLLSLLSKDEPTVIRTETLKVLTAVATTYFPLFSRHWFLILPEILSAIDSADMSCRLAATHLLETAMKTATQIETSEYNLEKWWNEILNNSSVFSLFHDTSYTVRANICNCFSHIPIRTFESLKRDKKIMLETTMLVLTRDEAAVVRAAASRTLGCYISFPSLKQDALFVSDVALALINGMRDNNLNVRNRSSWAIGNVCDALISIKEESKNIAVIDDIPKEILINMVKCSLDAAKDNDKVRSNAVRALGNFIRFAPSQLLLENVTLLKSVVDTLVLNLSEGSMKVKWNTCYAISNALHNPALQLVKIQCLTSSVTDKNERGNDNSDASLQELAISALITALVTTTNFKVRINAALALSVPTTQQAYGNRFAAVWKVILDSFKRVDSTDDPVGFQYKPLLIEQLLMTLLHLVRLITARDVINEGQTPPFYQFFVDHLENVLEILTTFVDELLRVNLSKMNSLSKLTQVEDAIAHIVSIISTNKSLEQTTNKYKDKLGKLLNDIKQKRDINNANTFGVVKYSVKPETKSYTSIN
jgi:HEAT repeat protein